MSELKNQVEAILFSVGKKISTEELSRLCRADPHSIEDSLKSLSEEYNARHSALMLVEEGNSWKIAVREEYAALLQNLVAETELPRSVLETLAIIAWKAPILQSEIVRIRTSKAYDHIGELEGSGFITKERHGRSWLIKLAQKFYDYFALKTKEDIQEKFKDLHAQASSKEMLGQLEVVNEEPRKLETYSERNEDKPKIVVVDEPEDNSKKPGN